MNRIRIIGKYKLEYDNKKITQISYEDRVLIKANYTDDLKSNLEKQDCMIRRLVFVKEGLYNDSNKTLESNKQLVKLFFVFGGVSILLGIIGINPFLPALISESLCLYNYIKNKNKSNNLYRQAIAIDRTIDQQLEDYHYTEDLINARKHSNNSNVILEANVNTNTNEKNKTLIK